MKLFTYKIEKKNKKTKIVKNAGRILEANVHSYWIGKNGKVKLKNVTIFCIYKPTLSLES